MVAFQEPKKIPTIIRGDQNKSFRIIYEPAGRTAVPGLPGNQGSPHGLPEDRGNPVWVSVNPMIKASLLGK